jgi:putative holliday junction resolvase
MNQNNILSLDVGERRIGVALANMAARLPAPLTVIDRLKFPEAITEIERLIRENNISTVIVGLPRGLDGQETEQTVKVRKFAANLSKAISQPVVLQDEAGTSLAAEELLNRRGKPYQKGDIDAEAAVLILQDWLNQAVRHMA